MTFEKFSFFDFSQKGIGKNSYDYSLIEKNFDEIPFILNPLTGKNVVFFSYLNLKLIHIYFITNFINLFFLIYNFYFVLK